MNKIKEALSDYEDDIVAAVGEITNKSSDEIKSILDQLPADDYINLVAAVDTDNHQDVKRLLGGAKSLSDQKPEANFVKQRIKEILAKDDDADTKLDKILDQVSHLTSQDWELIWPSIDPKWMSKLYQKATNQSVDKVTSAQADEIWHTTQDKEMEEAIYQEQIVEVKVPHGPQNTVGIVVEGKLKMVPKSEIKSLKENVMGMTSMPSLARMRELAGLPPVESPPVNQSGLLEAGALELKVIMDLDQTDPENLTRVRILGGAGSITIEGLRMKIARETREVTKRLEDLQDYPGALHWINQLTNSVNTMVAAEEDLEKVRRRGSTRSKNINPRIAEDEDS